MKPSDRTASYERVNIHLKVNALGLKLLNPQQSDQALHFLLVGEENITMFSRLTGLMLTGKYNVVTAIQCTYCKNSEYSRTSTSMARTLIARLLVYHSCFEFVLESLGKYYLSADLG